MELSLSNKSITFNNKQLFRYLSSSIPLACMVALLFISICIVNPNENSSNNAMLAFLPFSSSLAYAEGGSGNDSSTTHADAVGSTEIVNPTAELTVSGDLTQTTLAGLGSGPVYRSHNVSINVNDVTDYTLRVSYASSSNNTLEYYGTDGNSITTGGTTITGVGNGVKSTNMPENSWGFGWSDSTDTSDTELDYYTMPNYGSNNSGLAGGVLVSNSNSEGITSNTTVGKLVFAANFNNEAVAGHYKTSVLLSLAATPRRVATLGFGGITNMQDMTASICNAASVGDEGYLTDTRGGGFDNYGMTNTYKVTKLEDGRCWMTQNMKLDLSTTQLTSADSNVSTSAPLTWNGGSGTTLASENSGFSDGTQSTAKWNNGTGVTNSEKWKSEYGYYYNWCAATAGSCKDATANGAIASASVCPKGWKLPTKGEYDTFLTSAGITNDKGGSDKIRGIPYNFPYAGYVRDGSLIYAGAGGDDWSSTGDSGGAYYLYLGSSGVSTNNGFSRYHGFSVRCVADNQPKTEDEAEAITKGFGGIKKLQDMTSTVCNSVTNGTTGQLYDVRDLSIYDVAKLDDTKCWMTQNLRIVNKELTPADSNVSSNYTIPASSSPWASDSSINTQSKVHYANNTTNGAYYTWCAATAGSCSGAENNTDAKASSSICPRGWRLPTRAEYDTLIAKGASKIDSNTSDNIFDGYNIGSGFFPAAGLVSNGSLSRVGSYGSYWSSTASSSTHAYHLKIDSGGVGTNYSDYRYYGFSVRCIAQ